MTDTQSPTKLKACPFCGGEGRTGQGGGAAWVECTRPGCDVYQVHDTLSQAIAAWNTRTSETAEPVVSGEMIAAGYRAAGLTRRDLPFYKHIKQNLTDIYRAMHRASYPAEPPQDVVEATERLVEFIQDKLDNVSLSDEWWTQFDIDLRERIAALTAGERTGRGTSIRSIIELCASVADQHDLRGDIGKAIRKLKTRRLAAVASKEGSHGR
jgi:hypothetical protein